ncbi:hypothetical protein EXY23_06530 [Roseicella aquatilis]|uniref:DUF927 domain-containing protein n=2 Tax=Roseicella aquatilis TaxID=2527868 RepID=A0A4R4DRX6_9PROT|nr:hypothetical protein EXY23_06530 [Roseicella aquatilis]
MTRDPFAPLPAADSSAAEQGTWTPILPSPHPLPETMRHRRHGAPTTTWHYRDAAGALLFAVCRFDPAGARKEILPLSCGAEGWRWKALPEPRPLYGLDRLAARPAAPVLVVEGEKAADAAVGIFPDFAVVTWPGGAQAVGKADWSPLRGRLVAAWPDNDAPGHKAAAEVAKATSAAGAARAVVVPVPREWPKGWDVADPLPEGATADMLRDMLARAMAEPPRVEAPGDALRADVARAAAMAHEDWLAARLYMARRHRVPVAELDALRTEAIRAQRQIEGGEREAPTDPRGRADLLVDSADLPDTAAELATMLATRPHLFDRGGPARIARDRARDGFVVESLTLNGVVNETHRIARPWQWAKNRGTGAMERRDVTLPERVAKLYLDNRDGWGLRPLDGITSAPLLHPDGTIRVAEGYDPETRLWCERVPAVTVAAAPSREDAGTALLRLRRWFRTFAFADAERVAEAGAPVPVVDTAKPPGADESAFLCALLTAVCRPCLWLAPGLLARAPEYSGAGTGKGLLVRAICAIAFGARPVAMTAGAGTEELDKRITAALMEAGTTLFLDNVNSTALKSDVLASVITERPAAVRPLGRSATVQLNPTAFVAVTGNGLLLSEDMARRFLTVELDAGMEDPEARDFRGDLLRDTLAAREALLADALTIWRWGRQLGDALPAGRSLGSFTDWARWCRDPLVALGCRDPALRVADAKAKDPRRQQVGEIFTAWWEAHRDRPVAVADLAEPVRMAADPAGRGRQYLARVVRGLDGTRAAGFVLMRSASAGRWTPDRYALRRAPNEGRGAPMPPMPPMPSDAAASATIAGASAWSADL